MNIALVQRLTTVIALIVAVWVGWLVAEGEHALPALLASLAVVGAIIFVLRVPIATIALGLALFGYLVGNRGFAQLMPVPGLPLLPAEIALLVAGTWVIFECAWTHRLPFRRDVLNWVILLWIAVGSVRVFFDFRQFGFMAVRDFAMVYYALFFFLAQHISTELGARRFLLGVLVVASIAQPLAAVLSAAFPAFFFSTLAIRGVPLILFKGDLALTFAAVSAFLLAFAVHGRLRWVALVIATGELLAVIGGDNRASVLGALAGLTWLAFSRARKFVAAQGLALAGGFLLVAAGAHLTNLSWPERKYQGILERANSLTDYFGRGTYVSEESSIKGDNNRFRSVWWEAVIAETMDGNPALGLGFGHDLARNFLREYNPEMAEDFTARSPHSIVVTTFGRMGFVGLGILFTLVALMMHRTWNAVHDPATDYTTLGLWACVWTIFVSSCFGVVLEGPMGAVVFWTMLGLTNTVPVVATEPADADVDAEDEPTESAAPSRPPEREIAHTP